MAEREAVLGQVHLKNVRLSFPHLFRPQPGKIDKDTGKKGRDAYQSTFLMEKEGDRKSFTDANMAALKAAANAVKADKWGNNIPKMKADRVALRDGDAEGERDDYSKTFYLACRNYNKPKVVGKKKVGGHFPELTEEQGIIYAGCYVNAIVRLWAQDDPEFGKRINCSVEVVQFLADGDPFGKTAVNPDEALDEVEGDDSPADDFNADEGDLL